MILITGATGTIGRALADVLRAAHIPFRAAVRDPAKARALLGGEIETVRLDFEDAASLKPALNGVDALFLLTAPGPSVAAHDLAMLRALPGSGVKKVVKMSAFGADSEVRLPSSSWHGPGEKGVMSSGLAWTLLRPAGFMSNSLGWAAAIRAGAPIEVGTGAGEHGVVDPRDVAEVAARALVSADHDEKAYTLTGPAALSALEQLAIIEKALGKTIVVHQVTPERVAERMRTAGLSEAFAEAVREGQSYVREGKAASLSDDVSRVLGRAPRTFEGWVNDHLHAFSTL